VASRAPGFKLTNPVSLVAAVVAVVGSFLAWFDTSGGTVNAFDVAAPFLIDNKTTASDTLTVGVLIVVLGGAAGAICLIQAFGARVAALRGLGVALIAIAGAFAFQTVQTANDVGLAFGDIYGIGLFVTAIGGIGLLSAQ
jgi:hypothetical protein